MNITLNHKIIKEMCGIVSFKRGDYFYRTNKVTFIVCPSSLTYNWLSEIRKFAPLLQTIFIDGNKAERTKRLKEATDADVMIISYLLLRREINWCAKQSF